MYSWLEKSIIAGRLRDRRAERARRAEKRIARERQEQELLASRPGNVLPLQKEGHAR